MTEAATDPKAAEKQAAADAKAAKQAAAAEKKAQADAAKAQKAAEKAQKAADKKAAEDAKAAATVKDERNGVTRPKSGVTQKVWMKADEMSTAKGAPVDRADLTEALKGVVELGTVHTQYGRWRKYYGLSETKEARSARLAQERVLKEEAKAKAKADKDAQKAALAKEAAEAQAQRAAEQQATAPVDEVATGSNLTPTE